MIKQTFAPLRFPAFRLLLIGRSVNTLGNTFAPIALAFAVLDLTGSATDLGLVVGARTTVNVLFLLFGGVLADRLPRNLLMVGASALAAVTQGAVATLVLTHNATIPLLIGLSAINGMVAALSMPASAAILPQTVPEGERQQANALSRLFFNGAAVIGAPVAGVVVASIGPGWGIAVDATTFVVAGVAFAAIKLPAAAPAVATAGLPEPPPAGPDAAAPVPEGRKSIFADLTTGWGEFRSRTWLWVVVAGFCVLNACWSGALAVLGPAAADQSFGRRAWGFVLAAQTVGMIVGALVAMRVQLRRYLFFGVACVALEAVPILVLGTHPLVALLIPAAFLGGLGLEQFGVAWETTMQEHVPAEKLARVYSYDMLGSFIAIPIGEILAGPVASVAGLEPALVGAGALMLLSVAGMLISRDVRHLPHQLDRRAPEAMEELPA